MKGHERQTNRSPVGWITGVLVAGVLAAVLLAAQPWSHPATKNAASSSTNRQAPAVAITRTAGESTVDSYDPSYPYVHLEDDAHLCDAGEQTGCGILDTLRNGEQVIMRCWEDTTPPAGQTPPPGMQYNSSRWFYVNDVNGENPGYSGFIYSELVEQDTQISTPACTWALQLQYQYPASSVSSGSPTLTIVGSCTTTGGTLSAASSGFTPGGTFTVSATYPNGTAYPLSATSGTVTAQGSVPWQWPCAGDPPGRYSTTVTDQSTQQSVTAQFTIAAGTTSTTGTGQQPSVELARGGSAPAGSWYAIALQGFAADTAVSVTCYDSVSPGGFITFSLSTNAAGRADTSTGCFSGDGPDHWVTANGIASNHVTWSASSGTPTSPAPPPTTAPPPAPTTYAETVGGQTHTWTDYNNAGGDEGQTITAYTTVQITCRLQGFQVADGNTWWYRIASSPWSNQYYASADAFYNNGATSGSLHGTPWYDPNVPTC